MVPYKKLYFKHQFIMKKTITIITITIITINANAQENDSIFGKQWYKTLAIKSNFLSYIGGFINLQAEKAISNKASLSLIYVLGFKTPDGGGQGYSIGLEYRYYFKGKPLVKGLYLAPFIRYRDISFFQIEEYNDGNTGNTIKKHQPIPYTNYGGGVVLGKQLAFVKNKLLFDFYGGLDYNTESTKNNPALGTNIFFDAKKMYDSFMEGFGIRMGATIGYRL